MKVRELLEKLSKLDPEAEVFCYRGGDVFPKPNDEGVFEINYIDTLASNPLSRDKKHNTQQVFGKEDVALIRVIGFLTTPEARNARRKELKKDIEKMQVNIPQTEPWRGDASMTLDHWKAKLERLGGQEEETASKKKSNTSLLSIIIGWLR